MSEARALPLPPPAVTAAEGPAGSALARLFAALTPAQARAAAHPGPVLVLAGAGTGKTTTLTAAAAHRLAARGVPPTRLLCVTFTNKAAAEMRARLAAALGERAMPPWTGTFHGLAARQLRADPEVAGLRPGFDILDAEDGRRVLKRVVKAAKAEMAVPLDGGAGAGRDPLGALADRISRWKDALASPEEAAAGVEASLARAAAHPGGGWVDPVGLRAAARLYATYQRALREANAADFGDLLLWPTRAMLRDPRFGARWAGRFGAVLVDEYQDVNGAQLAWTRVLAAGCGDVFAVGDEDQLLYGFRGSDIARIRRFARDFPGAAVLTVEENFRSTGHILAAANAVIARDAERHPKTLWTRKADGDPVEVVAFRDAEAEAESVAREIVRRRAAEGVAWDEVAVLYRSNSLSRPYEEALTRARVPHVLVGDVGFWTRSEVKDALALLRLAEAPDDPGGDEAFRRVANTPPRGLGGAAMAEIEAHAAWRGVSLLAAVETAALAPRARAGALGFADAVRGVAADRALTVADRLSLLLERGGYRGALRASRAEDAEARLENLGELVALAQGFHSPRELLDHAALAAGAPGEDGGGRVRLMTIHRAKGLEFGHVFLVAWEEGVLPSAYGDPDEERRLAYVALTRGMRRVTVTRAAFRRGPARPSPFLADIPEAHLRAGWLHAAAAGRRGAPVPEEAER